MSCYQRLGKNKGVPTDEHITWIVLEYPIPSSLFVKDTQTYIHFSYEKQPITCHKCGSLAHKADKCDVFRNVRPQNRDNAIDIKEFPHLNGSVSTADSASRSSLSRDSDESQPATGEAARDTSGGAAHGTTDVAAQGAIEGAVGTVPGEAQNVPGEA